MDGNCEDEQRITNAIKQIGKNRNRAGYEGILKFCNRNDRKLEMETLKQVLGNMEVRNILINKGAAQSESFYLLDENLISSAEATTEIQDGEEPIINLLSYVDSKL